jgi:tagatose 6-phosphate kinase
MIVTVTPNPTIDRVVFVRNFAMQDLVRAEGEVVSASGKGIDVSILLHATFRAATMALGLNAGLGGRYLSALLEAQGIPHELIAAQGETRMSTLLTDLAAGRQSTIVAHTLSAGLPQMEALLDRLTFYAAKAWGVVCAGSLPPGLPRDAHAQLLRRAHEHNTVTLLDSSGEGLREGLRARPHILKINAAELIELAPQAMTHWQDLAGSAEHLCAHDATPHAVERLADLLAQQVGKWATEAIVVTLGKHGALAVTDTERLFAPAPLVPVVSAAGAGDALAAGVMLGRERGEPWSAALALGVATAAAVVMNAGTAECSAAEVDQLLAGVNVRTL